MPRNNALPVEHRLAQLARKRGQPEPDIPLPDPPDPIPLPRLQHWHTGGMRVLRQTQAQRKERFLQAFAERGNVGWALEQAGIGHRSTVHKWLEHDERFALAYRQADIAATERLEAEAWRRGIQGNPVERTTYFHGQPVGTDTKIEYSDGLLTLLLRARAPDKYRENVNLSVAQVIKTVSFDPTEVLGNVPRSGPE